MNTEDSEVIAQLKSIKRWVMLGALGFMFIGVGIIIFSISTAQMTSSFEKEYSEEECADKKLEFSRDDIYNMLQQGNINEAIEKIDSRLKTHPNDPSANWLKARSHYLNREWDLALEYLEKTEFYSPAWKEKFTVPLREQIEEHRK